MNIISTKVSILVQNLEKFSECGLFRAGYVVCQENHAGATIDFHVINKDLAERIIQLIKPELSSWASVSYVNTKKNGGEQHYIQILIDY